MKPGWPARWARALIGVCAALILAAGRPSQAATTWEFYLTLNTTQTVQNTFQPLPFAMEYASDEAYAASSNRIVCPRDSYFNTWYQGRIDGLPAVPASVGIGWFTNGVIAIRSRFTSLTDGSGISIAGFPVKAGTTVDVGFASIGTTNLYWSAGYGSRWGGTSVESSIDIQTAVLYFVYGFGVGAVIALSSLGFKAARRVFGDV